MEDDKIDGSAGFSAAYQSLSEVDHSFDGNSISEYKMERITNSELTTIYREYEPTVATDEYYRFDSHGKWKTGRPSFVRSLLLCLLYSFYTTILAGIPAGFVAILLTWLDLNLAEACYSYNNKWNKIPLTVRRIRLTAQVLEGMMIQFWSFTALLYVFGWKKVKDQNIPIWNVLAAAVDAIYRLFLSLYGLYNRQWLSYPLNLLFLSITCFNYYRITAYFVEGFRARFKLAVKFGTAFLFGIPMYLVMVYLLLPVYKHTDKDIHKAVFSSLLPVVFVVPKAVIIVCLVDASQHCDPGRLAVLIVGFQTMATIVARYLQANVEKGSIFIALCFIHGIENLIDKLTWNLRNRAYRYFCGPCIGKDKEEQDTRQMNLNRIQADNALSGMILETDTIVMSCALVGILSYYYETDRYGNGALVHEFLFRICLSCLIELLLNAVAIKIQTYYFNMPVMLVWKKKWYWIVAGILTYTVYTMIYCSEYLYGAVVTLQKFNQTVVKECLKPFQKPHT